jgi:hypothetical protein
MIEEPKAYFTLNYYIITLIWMTVESHPAAGCCEVRAKAGETGQYQAYVSRERICSLQGKGSAYYTHTQTHTHTHTHLFIHSSSLSYDRPNASSKASSPHSAIQSFLFQMRVSSPFLKVIQ